MRGGIFIRYLSSSRAYSAPFAERASFIFALSMTVSAVFDGVKSTTASVSKQTSRASVAVSSFNGTPGNHFIVKGAAAVASPAIFTCPGAPITFIKIITTIYMIICLRLYIEMAHTSFVLIEGKNAVSEMLDSTATVDKVMMFKGTTEQALVNKIKAAGVHYQFVDKPTLDRLSKTKNHQGFIAFVTDYKYYSLDDIIDKAYARGTQPLILILDGVEDPHNLGNIIRTAECMGVDGIIIPKNRAASVNETVVRVSAGATAHMHVTRVININHEIEMLKERGFWIFYAEAGGLDISQTKMNGPIVIIMGGENTGVRQLTRSLADARISIPMHGKVNSLNVANATAMVLYEINRQRNTK